MKKWWFSIGLVMILVAALVVGGCAKPAPTPTPTPKPVVTPSPTPKPTAAAWPKALRLGTAPVGSSWYTWIAPWVSLMSKKVIQVGEEATSGGDANMRLIKVREMDMGTCSPNTAYWAARGIDEYATPELGKIPIRCMFLWYPMQWLIVTLDPNIKTFDQVRGKKVTYIVKGARSLELYTEAILKAYGMTTRDIIPREGVSTAAGRDDLKNRTTDVWVIPGPHPMVLELAETMPTYFVSVKREVLEGPLNKEFPFVGYGEIPPNTYRGQKEAVPVLTGWCSVLVRKDLPDDLIYQMTKTTFENMEALVKESANFKWTTIQNAVGAPLAPYHPGAIKYYKEAGVWTSKLDAWQAKALAESG